MVYHNYEQDLSGCGVIAENIDEAMEQVSEDPFHIRFFSKELRSNRQLVESAIAKNPKTFQFVAEELRLDQDFLINFLEKDPENIIYLTKQEK